MANSGLVTKTLAGHLGAGVEKRGKVNSTTQPTSWKLGTNFLLLSWKGMHPSLSLHLCSRTRILGKKTIILIPPPCREMSKAHERRGTVSSSIPPLNLYYSSVALKIRFLGLPDGLARCSCKGGRGLLVLPLAPLFGRAFIFASIAFKTQSISSKSHTDISSVLPFTILGERG